MCLFSQEVYLQYCDSFQASKIPWHNMLENKHELLPVKADEPSNHLIWHWKKKKTKPTMFLWKPPYEQVFFLSLSYHNFFYLYLIGGTGKRWSPDKSADRLSYGREWWHAQGIVFLALLLCQHFTASFSRAWMWAKWSSTHGFLQWKPDLRCRHCSLQLIL